MAQRTTASQESASREALLRHLQIPALDKDAILQVVNVQRKLLALPELTGLSFETVLDAGLSASQELATFNKTSALRDLAAFGDASKAFGELGHPPVEAIAADLAGLEADPELMLALKRLSFVEQGLSFVDGPSCPLCDLAWDDTEQLQGHLQAKVEKSRAAQALQASLIENASKLSAELIRIIDFTSRLFAIAKTQIENEIAAVIEKWQASLSELKSLLTSIEGIVSVRDRLSPGVLVVPEEVNAALKSLVEKTTAKPDQTTTLNAQTFLTTAQLRLADFREARRKNVAARAAHTAAKATYDTYCEVMEDELNALYDAVQGEFSAFYRAINDDDELKFTAKLTPSEGKLDFLVNFYERGLFPPGAYHSEGHQDGMGICLYLALMKRLFGEQFTFALLDDVLMSVDSGHRLQFCKLLKTHFADTQFIITTHDRLWAEQMRHAGLVSSKTSLAFHSWTVDTGPLVESNDEIWDEIDKALDKGRVETAAAALRRHLEYISRLVADQLSAPVPFRGDGNFELGDLLPSALARMQKLYGKAADAAQSWGNDAAKSAVGRAKDTLAAAAKASGIEQWAVNKAVHYNEWANFGKTDFKPVVAAFKDLLQCFRCGTCGSWLYLAPRTNSESLRCACNAVNLNLKQKPK